MESRQGSDVEGQVDLTDGEEDVRLPERFEIQLSSTATEVDEATLQSLGQARRRRSRARIVLLTVIGVIAAIVAALVIVFVVNDSEDTMDPSDGRLHFYAVGDWGRGNAPQRAVADGMRLAGKLKKPAFIISTGDNFYDDGVSSETDAQFKDHWDSIYNGSAIDVPWYLVLGNHDYHQDPLAEIRHCGLETRFGMPARYYRVDYSPGGRLQKLAVPGSHEVVSQDCVIGMSLRSHLRQKSNQCLSIIYTDTQPMLPEYWTHLPPLLQQDADVEYNVTRQFEWLESQLKDARSECNLTIVVGHLPVYSSGEHGSTQNLQANLESLLERHGVAAYLCGHDHDIEYLQGASVDYFVTGAGSTLRTFEAEALSSTVYRASENSFLDVAIDWALREVTYTFRDVSGAALFERSKNF